MLYPPRRSRSIPSRTRCLRQLQSTYPYRDFHSPSTKLRDSSTDDLICQECREGLFAPESFQQAWTSSGLHHGFSYTATWTQVQVSAERGCEWCKLVLSMKVDGMEKQHILQVTAGVRQSGEFDDITPKGTQILRLTVNGTHHADYYVYADRGTVDQLFCIGCRLIGNALRRSGRRAHGCAGSHSRSSLTPRSIPSSRMHNGLYTQPQTLSCPSGCRAAHTRRRLLGPHAAKAAPSKWRARTLCCSQLCCGSSFPPFLPTRHIIRIFRCIHVL